jgi:hypothetical protein
MTGSGFVYAPFVRGGDRPIQLIQLPDASDSPNFMIVSTGQLSWVTEYPFTTFDFGPVS